MQKHSNARNQRPLAALALLMALVVFASACSSGDAGSSSSGPNSGSDTPDDSQNNDSSASNNSASATNTNTTVAACVPRTGDRITVYSGRSESLMAPVLDDYECVSGNAVDVRWGSSTELALLLGEEADRSPADVFLSRSPGPVGYLQGRNLLRPLDQAVLNLVPANYRSDSGHWVGFTGRKRVLVYNTDNTAAADLPDSVFELTGPKYEGRVAIPGTNGSFVDWFTVFRLQYGDDMATAWINDMTANGARYYPNNRSIVEAASRGEIDFGLVNHYYNYQEAAANGASHRAANHELGEQDIGALLIITAASVTSHSEKADLAHDLIAYILAEPSQRFFTDSSLEYPLATGVVPNEVLPEIVAPSVGSVGFDDLGAGFERTNAIIEASGILNQ